MTINHRIAMSSLAAVSLCLSACAQPSSQAGSEGMIPSDHWSFSTFENHGTFSIAAILADTKDDDLNVICAPDLLYVAIYPRAPLPAAGHRGLSLSFDGRAPVVQHWRTGTVKGQGVGSQDFFQVNEGDPEFRPVIAAFQQHREVDVSITDSGTEVQHHTFTLNGAPEQIAKVLAACKKAS